MNMLPYSGFPALPNKMEDMHKQLVALGLNDVEALTARIKKCEAWVDAVEETELTGNPVIYQNALALPAVDCVATFSPDQDLHGYDKPWPGGADVNKFDISSATMAGLISAFGLTVAKDSDGYITITGTYIGESGIPKFAIIPTLPVLADAVFYLMDKNTDANNNVIQCRWANAETGGVAIDLQNMVPNQAYNIKFRLMIVTDGTAPTAFRPYANECPITGHASLTITDTDADSQTVDFTIQFDETVFGGTANLVTGEGTLTDASVDLGSLTWTYSSADKPYFYVRYSGIKSPGAPLTNAIDAICSIYPVSARRAMLDGDNLLAGDGTATEISQIQIRDTDYTDATLFKAALNGQTLCYKLATPVDITFDPVTLQLVAGLNVLSSADADSLTVKAYTGGPWEAVSRTIKKVTNKTKTTKKRRK